LAGQPALHSAAYISAFDPGEDRTTVCAFAAVRQVLEIRRFD